MASTASARVAAELADAVARALLPLRARVRAGAVDRIDCDEDLLSWAQALSIAPASPVWLGVSAETWRRVQAEAGADDSFSAIASRAISEFAQLISARLDSACFPMEGAEADQPATGNFLRLQIDAGKEQLVIFASMPAVLAGGPENASTAAPSMDLLLDVELPVSVSFGRAFLPVRDVLRMTTGSMIELNRHVNDYVDVIVNNCVIARGEVVVIEGNYGIRVHEIVSRRERAMLQQVGRGASIQPVVKASL